MILHRYVYTRLSKDLSPTGKNGFQSAFLPGDLLTNKEVLEIESHIHFPEGLQIESQSVVFYKVVKGHTYLVLLMLRPLTEVKDEHGRGGTFLCEGFLLAEDAWREVRRLSDLKRMVLAYQFGSLDELLNSPDVDRVNGRIKDLHVDVIPGYWEGNREDEEPEPEEEMLMAMYHVTREADRDLAVVVEGEPDDVSLRLQTCTAFLPSSLLTRVGWDDAFDGGKIFFSPLRIFGYSSIPPTTGRPAIFPADHGPAQWTEPEMAKWGKPSDPFSHWLLEVCVNAVPRDLIDKMYALSEAMRSGRPTSENMPSNPIFELVNRETIEDMFVQGLTAHLELPWAEKLAEFTNTNQQLKIWMQHYQVESIARLLEQTILREAVTPEVIASAPPEKLVRLGGPTLQALASMWTQELADPTILDAIPENELADVLTLLLGRGPHQNCQLDAVVRHCADLLADITDDSKVAENLVYYVAECVPAEYKSLKTPMATTAVELQRFDCLKGEEIDWLLLLNQYLEISGGELADWKAIKQLAKVQGLEKYLTLAAFALGGAPNVPSLKRSGPCRTAYLRCLREVHGLKETELLELGFKESELESTAPQGGFLGKIKRLFGGS